jgi:hypothetical protein
LGDVGVLEEVTSPKSRKRGGGMVTRMGLEFLTPLREGQIFLPQTRKTGVLRVSNKLETTGNGVIKHRGMIVSFKMREGIFLEKIGGKGVMLRRVKEEMGILVKARTRKNLISPRTLAQIGPSKDRVVMVHDGATEIGEERQIMKMKGDIMEMKATGVAKAEVRE